MNMKGIFEMCIHAGIAEDPRGKKEVEKILKKREEAYKKMEKEDKEYFDKETLWNPFNDSRIVNDDGRQIKTVMIGIDIEGDELLLANELNKQGEKIDCVWAHHPEGKALMGLDNVMAIQIDTLAAAGVPVNQAEAIMKGRIKEVSEALSPANSERIEQMAKLLKINMMNTHTPADNHVEKYLGDLMKTKKPETLEDII